MSKILLTIAISIFTTAFSCNSYTHTFNCDGATFTENHNHDGNYLFYDKCTICKHIF